MRGLAWAKRSICRPSDELSCTTTATGTRCATCVA